MQNLVHDGSGQGGNAFELGLRESELGKGTFKFLLANGVDPLPEVANRGHRRQGDHPAGQSLLLFFDNFLCFQ